MQVSFLKERVDTIFAYMISFFPSLLQYHVDHSRVHFYVADSATASALQKCSHKITDRDGYKVCCLFG